MFNRQYIKEKQLWWIAYTYLSWPLMKIIKNNGNLRKSQKKTTKRRK